MWYTTKVSCTARNTARQIWNPVCKVIQAEPIFKLLSHLEKSKLFWKHPEHFQNLHCDMTPLDIAIFSFSLIWARDQVKIEVFCFDHSRTRLSVHHVLLQSCKEVHDGRRKGRWRHMPSWKSGKKQKSWSLTREEWHFCTVLLKEETFATRTINSKLWQHLLSTFSH